MTHRPELHVTPETGILDAPAGVLFDGYSWHIFHQFRPRPEASPRWAHQVSHGSAFSWEVCDDVLAPEGKETAIRAGAVTGSGEKVDLYYTSVSGEHCAIHKAEISDLQATTELVSDEGAHVDEHVRRLGVVAEDLPGFSNFRSPCVIPDWHMGTHRGWLMLAVAGSVHRPELVVFQSDSGQQWQFQGALQFAGDPAFPTSVVVAPRLFRLRDLVDGLLYDILMVTVELEGYESTGYLVGHLQDTTFQVLTPFTRLDHGYDFTRPRMTNRFVDMATVDSDVDRFESAVLFGLLNGIGRGDNDERHESLEQEKWANCLSLPRRVTLENKHLFQTPPTGLPEAVSTSDAAKMWVGICEIPAGEQVKVELCDSIGQVAAVVTHRGDALIVDRSMNAFHQGDPVATATLCEADTDAITIIVDGSTVEVFADGGQVAMASRIYFNGHCEEFHVTTSPGAEVVRREIISGSHLDDYHDPEGLVR